MSVLDDSGKARVRKVWLDGWVKIGVFAVWEVLHNGWYSNCFRNWTDAVRFACADTARNKAMVKKVW